MLDSTMVIPQSYWYWELHTAWLCCFDHLSAPGWGCVGWSKLFLLKLSTCISGWLFLLTGSLLTLHDLVAFLQLCYDLTSNLNRLLEVADDTFWRTGWVHIRVQHQMAFIFNGLLPCLLLVFVDVLGVKITGFRNLFQ